MKNHLLIAALILSLSVLSSCKEKKEVKLTELKTPAERLGYALGSDIGKSFQKNEMEIDQQAFFQGFVDGRNDNKPLLTPEEIKEIQQAAVKEMKEKFANKRKEEAEKNKKDGDAFLAENGKKDGVVTTDSGLQYMVIKEGDGEIPSAADRVKVNYAGSLIDGTEFDSSYKRGKPSTFSVKGVIPGWTEALQLMKAGSKWKLFVPSNLAYRERWAGKLIGPNSTLIFDIELVEIVKKAETAPKPEQKS